MDRLYKDPVFEHQATLFDLGFNRGLSSSEQQTLNEFKNIVNQHNLTCVELSILNPQNNHSNTAPTGLESVQLFKSNNDSDYKFELSDSLLLRFLVARKFEVEKALQLLKEHLAWRDNFRPTMLRPKDLMPHLYNSGVYRNMGTTKEGHNVLQFQLKLFDPYAQELDQYLRYVVFCVERSLKCMTMRTKNVWIFDLDGWGMTTHGTPRGNEFTQEVLMLAQNHYPERLHRALIVNAPWLFSTAWSIISGWLDKKTQEKVLFINSKKELLNYIDINTLPKQYGGNHDEYPIHPDDSDN